MSTTPSNTDSTMELSPNPIEQLEGKEKQNEKKEDEKMERQGNEEQPSSFPSNDSMAGEHDATKYPKTGVVMVIMTGIYLAGLLVALDKTIISTAIPRITDDFHSLGDVGWYGSAYLLTNAAFQLVFGRIYTFFSPKWVFLVSITIFEVGSAVCGAAPNSDGFIVGRAIAGLGSAGIFSGSTVLIVHTVPLHKRPLYTGLIGSVFGIASVAGPLLGGAFTQNVSWRWCFYINLPIGCVTLFIIFFLLHLPPTAHLGSTMTVRQILLKLDPLGNLFFLPSIICLLLALQWGGSTYAWNNPRIIALLVVFAILLIAFIAVQYFLRATATIPIHIIKQRSILFGTIFSVFVGGSMIALIYYLPIWFQAIKGVSAVESGIRNIPMLLGLFITSILSGIIITLIGYYTPFMIACSIFMSIGAGLMTTFTINTPSSQWIGYQALFGIGIGLGLQQPILAAQTILPNEDVPTGTSLMFFAQSLGGSIAVSIASNVFNSGLISGLENSKIKDINPAAIINAGATGLRGLLSKQDTSLVLKIYNDALMDAFIVGVAFACCSVIGVVGMEWKSVKQRKKNGAENGSGDGGGEENVDRAGTGTGGRQTHIGDSTNIPSPLQHPNGHLELGRTTRPEID
ncbi:MAG: hypothetical protein M1834_007617 [Cirrosporium novae-zelandiae]|nr:MAG: hypothetical protein M1834_007617 [Cirrosporium novae-zelandiae]